MKTMILICAILAIVCCGCEERPDEAGLRVEVISVRFFKNPASSLPYSEYEVRVRIYSGGAFHGAGQDVRMTCSNYPEATAVEYFDISARNWEWHDDIHRDIANAAHHMVLYPANVDGVDFNDKGFAMLPANIDGNVTDNIPAPYWNANGHNREYRDHHSIRGRFTRVGEPLRWSIVPSGDGIDITIDGKTKFYPAAGHITIAP